MVDEVEDGASDRAAAAFANEVARVQQRGVFRESGRLAELFAFFAARGPNAPAASQAELAETVFGQVASESDDATVRVYIHRLRKRLDEFYAGEQADAPRLVIPSGTYALRLSSPRQRQEESNDTGGWRRAPAWQRAPWLVALLLLVAGAFFIGRMGQNAPVPVNALWQPFVDSNRPIVIVVGDYYIFGEVDPDAPERARLVREFRINSKTDLARMQQADPAHYATTEDMGLNYLPVASAYGLSGLMPILAQNGRKITVIPASQMTGDMFRSSNVVYIGLVSGMGMLEDVNFSGSGLAVGGGYDELIDLRSGESYISQEARNLASSNYYRDYGYVARFREPGGALVAVVSGSRDTGLRGLASILAGPGLPTEIDKLADRESAAGFEALFEITGQQGANLSDRLVLARARK